eukprot:TRINITY_DN3556_c0_g1_i1.p1 TRINITY_DN3556_c0_g1~~TRINITY_DN3556_c0_g1_i1.p1  ORF type:complete len:170 (-),score=25.81 TRINITY_DN3556_c0_g1_i1:192-701(-)
MMSGMADMVLSLFFVALWTIFVCLSAIILAKRIDNPGEEKYMDNAAGLYDTGDYSSPAHQTARQEGEPVPMTEIEQMPPPVTGGSQSVIRDTPMDLEGVGGIQHSATMFVNTEAHQRQESVDPNQPVEQMIHVQESTVANRRSSDSGSESDSNSAYDSDSANPQKPQQM